jgi:LSD1 subclass zinc finger protein
MEETKTTHAPEHGLDPAKPTIHRVCEGCNNMFATHPGSKELRCPKCKKE